jgi:hypothetical protein
MLSEKRAEDQEKFLSGFVYPFIGLTGVAAFVGILFTRRDFELQMALKSAIRSLLSAFGGFFLASYLVSEIWHLQFKRVKDVPLCRKFVGYSSVLMFSVHILLSLFPEFFFLRFLILYTIYIVWEGAVPYMGIREPEQLRFVSLSTGIIVLAPYILDFIVGVLMPGLKY